MWSCTSRTSSSFCWSIRSISSCIIISNTSNTFSICAICCGYMNSTSSWCCICCTICISYKFIISNIFCILSWSWNWRSTSIICRSNGWAIITSIIFCNTINIFFYILNRFCPRINDIRSCGRNSYSSGDSTWTWCIISYFWNI